MTTDTHAPDTDAPAPYRAGTVAVVGRPNVGKSTLINLLVGAKVSIVSPRPQTTRHRLLGIATFPEGQLMLVDTPGIHGKQPRAMNRYMNRAARGAVSDVDAALLLIEAGKWVDDDALAYSALKEAGVRCVLVINKVDKLPDKGKLLPFIAQVTAGREFAQVFLVSALKGKGTDLLVKDLIAMMPESEAHYGEERLLGLNLDSARRYPAFVAELEQAIRALHPYELPEVIAVPVSAGLPAYLEWIAQETRKEIDV